MKTFHVLKENYPTKFTYTRPDDYHDGFLEKHSWLFEVCDWCGSTIQSFTDESDMLRWWEELPEDEDTQILAYPLVDDIKVHQGGYWATHDNWEADQGPIREQYAFPATW